MKVVQGQTFVIMLVIFTVIYLQILKKIIKITKKNFFIFCKVQSFF